MSEPQTVGQAVERAGRVSGAVKMIEVQDFASVLPAHLGERKFTRWALKILEDPKIIEVARTDAGRLSIVSALLDCASLGLEPGRTYHLVPFGGTVTGITDYKGEIELMYRANRAAAPVCRLVHEKDSYAQRGANYPPLHEVPEEIGPFGDRGPVIGGYAYVQLSKDVYSMVVEMREEEFLRHRAKARTAAVWDEWPEAMRLKTLLHELRKFAPWSAEWVA